jgi:hypothetical protein
MGFFLVSKGTYFEMNTLVGGLTQRIDDYVQLTKGTPDSIKRLEPKK